MGFVHNYALSYFDDPRMVGDPANDELVALLEEKIIGLVEKVIDVQGNSYCIWCQGGNAPESDGNPEPENQEYVHMIQLPNEAVTIPCSISRLRAQLAQFIAQSRD